jgi:iron complex transport system ATP-binding protein
LRALLKRATVLDVSDAVELRGVRAGYGADVVLEDVTLTLKEGELTVVLGPNGAGKSTLLKLLWGALQPTAGDVSIFGEPLARFDRASLARRVALVPQAVEVALDFSVEEVVTMGRAPHQGVWMHATGKDREAVERAMTACDLMQLRARPVATLSGGEQKRVAIARALAQEPKLLLLDEATAYLDVRHALEVHELLLKEIAGRKLACVAVMHDLNTAAQYADHVVLVKNGRITAHGKVEEVMTYRRLCDLFEAELYVGVNELDGTRYFLPCRPSLQSRPS